MISEDHKITYRDENEERTFYIVMNYDKNNDQTLKTHTRNEIKKVFWMPLSEYASGVQREDNHFRMIKKYFEPLKVFLSRAAEPVDDFLIKLNAKVAKFSNDLKLIADMAHLNS